MTNNDHKDKLFDYFFRAAGVTLRELESHFHIKGVMDQVFGKDVGLTGEEAKTNLRNSNAWAELSALYDYAIHGVISPDISPADVVLDGAEVIRLANSHFAHLTKEWEDIILMGDGRFGLDEGEDCVINKLALLAKVDVRTVRNAISAGSLVSYKRNDLNSEYGIFIKNASARRWLQDRKGFQPTVRNDGNEFQGIESVNSPAEFGAFLVSQRTLIGLDSKTGKLMVFHPSVDPKALTQLEAGVFALPLDAVFPLADFYQVSRKDMLNCVMRVFFGDELLMLSSDSLKEGSQP